MLKHMIVTALVAVSLATPAYAFHCPADIAKIDAALAANPSLNAQLAGTVKTLRDTGERLHNAGKHADAVKTLAGALQILKNAGISVD